MRYLLLIVALFLFPGQLAALEAPPLTGRVTDLARMLSPESQQQLEQKLAAFERETSNQVVVLTVPSLQGDDIDRFSIRVAEAWKIGQKGRDNGVLLIIAQAERKVRIEVGMGLQGVLPDITAGRIIRDVMRPHLKSGNYDQGIAAGVDGIIAATKGEFKGTGQPARNHVAKTSSPSFAVMLLGAVVAIAVLGLFSRYLGGAAGAVGFPLATYLAFPALGLVTFLLLAVGGLVAGLLLSKIVSSLFAGGGGGGFGGWGGGWGGGFYGGGGGSSSGGDDSFSGGGGDFDGGGSSDDY
ncbi:MAG: hypothetical protein A2076_08475 [Geobacteraceae bacterium GWC2_53_11]|nr:MAG: hypothetical protein A2076_08475 [Geobacteraceae bacterium GWC2_53_11]